MLSPWTAPRGDDDGLWLLIVPTLFVFVGVLVLVAVVVASVHVWLDDRDARDRPPKLRR
jgi:hypothetical protein